MPYEKKIDNMRIEVVAEVPVYFGLPAYTTPERHAHEELLKQIRRHVDGIESISIEWEHVFECSHCGHQENIGGEYPWCCDAAQAEWKAANPGKPIPD